MGLFSPTPSVKELTLKKNYKFMYENFVFSSQQDLYLLLEENSGIISALKFDFSVYKYGYPNDEALATHPLAKFGLKWYSLFEVVNSPWIEELKAGNRIHPGHNDTMYADRKHYIVTFKDVTLDVIASDVFEEVELTTDQLFSLINEQLGYLKRD